MSSNVLKEQDILVTFIILLTLFSSYLSQQKTQHLIPKFQLNCLRGHVKHHHFMPLNNHCKNESYVHSKFKFLPTSGHTAGNQTLVANSRDSAYLISRQLFPSV